tara:strand:- start:474 stop:1097 length:624 start_codon:yes stop_codon:yes gene_type:complete
MSDFIISIIGNKIFSEIINEIKLFSKFKIKYYENIDLCIEDNTKENKLFVFFNNSFNKKKINDLPSIVITENSKKDKKIFTGVHERLKMPFRILDFEKKIISLIAKYEFKKNSLINLGDYIVDKNERKIKKNNLELQLSEKEIEFLVLFSEESRPINRNLVLKKVWKYSEESETHTVETHIHRLRKKILEKFGDTNFIKNNNEGYYI